MINLCELLQITKEDFTKYKVHFATGSTDKKKPYNAFLIDEFQDWQEHQTNKNFGRAYILSLIYYERDIWMFGGIYKVLPSLHFQSQTIWGGAVGNTKLRELTKRQNTLEERFLDLKKSLEHLTLR